MRKADDADSEELSFSEFMEATKRHVCRLHDASLVCLGLQVILQFRGSNTATVKDMVDFRKWFTVQCPRLAYVMYRMLLYSVSISCCFCCCAWSSGGEVSPDAEGGY